MDTLYHYCSNETFCAIASSSTIRLSALTFSNDSTEGRLLGKLLADIVSKDRNDSSKVDYLEVIMAALTDMSPGFGFCLSKKGDLLSQWRGYADDGKGVSIGFNKTYINNSPISILVPPTLEDVIYEETEQREVLQNRYKEI